MIKKTIRNLMILPLLLLGATAVSAQQANVTGRVVSADTRAPLANAHVGVAGTNIGALTNADGRYSVPAAANATLVFSMLGYGAQRVPVQGRSNIDVELSITAIALDEIVAVGYTTQTRRSIAGAVTSVSPSAIEARSVTTVGDALKGRAAGVVVRNTGEPGQEAAITIRGSAFTANNDPLYVVDGMYLSNLQNIAPSDIESIQILKDASAASQYGARAANGVIVITTKKGQAAGRNRITMRSSYGFQNAPKYIDMMNSRQWAEMYTETYTNSRLLNPLSPTVPAGAAEVLSGQNTNDVDWQREVTQPGHVQDHVLSISGGTDNGNATYFVSGGYTQQEGIILSSNFDRYSLRANSQFRRGRLTVTENLLVARSNSRNANTPNGALGQSLVMFPSIPLLNDGNFGPPQAIYGIGTANYPSFADNPVGGLLGRNSTSQRNEILSSLAGNFDIFEGLKYSLQVGLRYTNAASNFFGRTEMIRQNTGPFPASLSVNSNNTTQVLLENLLNLNRTFGIHSFNATAGYIQERSRGQSTGARRAVFGDENIQVLDAGVSEISNSGSKVESRLNSWLVRAGYTLMDRYLLEANYRRDGSTRFGPLNRWGEFYSGALGWIVSDETFFSSLPLIGGASYLKLRGSYGTQGNQDFADYEWQATMTGRDTGGETQVCCSYLFGTGTGTIVPGLATVSLNNPSLKWQDNEMTNVGFDLGLFDNRLSITAEYYRSKSEGVLARVPLIPSLGSRTSPFVNAASFQNTGFEASIQHTMSLGDLNLTTGLNVTTLKNETLALGGQEEDIISGAHRTAVGKPMGSFWVMETCGIFDTQAEIDAHGVQPDALPGDVCFVDQDGDGRITQNEDKHDAGAPYPDFDTGLFIDGTYRAFDFRLGVRSVFGLKVYNALIPTNPASDVNLPASYVSWKNPGDYANGIANAPKAYWGNLHSANNYRGPRDLQLEDAGFVRFQNVSLGYRLPENLLSSVGLQLENARVYLNLQDIYTWTDYTGFDPEIRTTNALAPGTDGGGTYPNPRTITIGVDIGF